MLGQHRQPGTFHHDLYRSHQPSVTDPTLMTQLDLYQIGVQVPYSSIRLSPVAQITNMSRLSVTVTWASMVDSPFQIAPYLPAQ